MEDYDISAAFKAIEEELIASMIRNMSRHRAEETKEGIQWSMWQAEQLKSLEKYKRDNRKRYGKKFLSMNGQIAELIRQSRQTGKMKQERRILQAIRKGWKVHGKNATPAHQSMTGEFFRLNDRKLDALVEATVHDMQKAETAVLRMANDEYRKAIFNAHVYANTGAGTYEKAVDMATKEMLSRGLTCVVYSNGARHTLSDYADMAIRTASKRAYLQGEGEKRKVWGITTVIVNKRSNPCPKCLPFCGKVLIDDVWSGGTSDDGPYLLMSKAIEAGLYHPRCKDSHTTYFPGISTADDTWTQEELEAIGQANRQKAKQQYAERQADKYGRLAEYSLDKENKQMYAGKASEWKAAGVNEESKYAGQKDTSKGFFDITEQWFQEAVPNSHAVADLTGYTVNGITYPVDGKCVLLDYADKEKQIAELLERELGGEISMVPRVLSPQGVSTPDYIFRCEPFDLKELSGVSKNLIYNAVAKKKRQSSNFVLDISQCPLSEEKVERQIGYVYWSRHTSFIDKIILVKNDHVIKIFARSK